MAVEKTNLSFDDDVTCEAATSDPAGFIADLREKCSKRLGSGSEANRLRVEAEHAGSSTRARHEATFTRAAGGGPEFNESELAVGSRAPWAGSP